MITYFAILILLMANTLISLWLSKYKKIAAYSSTILLIFFSGLRFETGYDWQGYESFYRSIFGINGILCIGIPKHLLVVEPLFFFLNVIFKSFTANIFYLNFFIAIFNMSVIHFVCSRLSRSVPQMWMLYYGLAFLISQMTTIRQGIASSIIILSIYFASKHKIKCAIFALFFAMGFHVSSIIFLPLIFLRKLLPTKKVILAIVFLGLLFSVSGLQIQNHIFRFASTIPNLWMASKFSSYFNSNHAISLGTFGIIIYHLFVLTILIYKTTNSEKKTAEVIITIWLTLLSIASHLYFPGLPSIWNRVMFVTLPIQVATLYRLDFLQNSGLKFITISVVGIFLLSSISLFYSLKKESSNAFIPYYSILNHPIHRTPDWKIKIFEDMIAIDEKNNKGQLKAGPRRELFEPLLTPIFDFYCKP